MNAHPVSPPLVDQARWKQAQQYEAEYWRQAARRIEDEEAQIGWYEWRAEHLRKRLSAVGKAGLADGTARLLEVGSGPVGLAAFFPAARRVSIDPLASFYTENPSLVTLRSPAVQYDEGIGENLPYADAAFDLVVIENCIDHVRDVEAVMREITRVLDRDGILYMTVNCRTRWGYLLHRLLSRLRVDVGHPHTFTTARIRRLVNRHGFRFLEFDSGSYREAWWKYLTSGDVQDGVQAVLGVNHFTVSLVAERSSPEDDRG